MKKLALSVVVLAGLALLASCKKDNTTTEGTFKASIEQQNQNGKTAIDTTGTQGVITWSENDQILISNGTEDKTFTLQTGAGSDDGTFSTNGEFDMTGNYTAAYPATANINGTTVTFSLPATQTMADGESGTFANGANPMVAVASGETNLAFKNPCGGLGIRLKGATEGVTVTNIRIIGSDTDVLWGDLTVTMNGNGTVASTSIANTATDKNKIDLTCNVTLSTTEAKRFFIVLPEGALQHGFTLEVSYGAADPYSKSTGDTNIAQVERNMMKSLNAITIGAAAPGWDGNLAALTGSEPEDYVTATDGMTIYGTLAANVKVSIADGATVTLSNATITYSSNSSSNNYAGITCLGDATIVLGGNNTVKPGFYFWPCLYVAPDKTLTINGDGSLNANNAGSPSAGIGGGYEHPCGNIVINGGNITASSGSSAAIGGGYNSVCGSITITGGNITASASGPGAAIGGGYSNSTCGDITISGGTINATSNNAAGIGAGIGSSCSSINISGGTITAKGGGGCAHIGAAQQGTCGNITISGGTIIANVGPAVTGIGSSAGYSCGNISISGGDITVAGLNVGIGASVNGPCGDITITGGTISATGQNVGIGANNGSGQICGNISISNATVTAQGTNVNEGCGIGICSVGTIGNITICDNVVQVTAIKGTGAANCIGKGVASTNPTIGTITVGGTEYPSGVDANVDNVTFVYPFQAPVLTTGNVTAIIAADDPCAATGHVTMTDAGTIPATEIGICWGTSSQPTVGSSNYAAATGTQLNNDYTVNMTGLASGTRYYVRGYAKVGNNYYYASDEKTVRTVFLIYNLSDWNAFAAVVNGGESTVHAFQKANISGVTTVVGNSESNPFKGTYNGQGYAISNVSISGGTHVGLFGYVNDASAVIENVVVASGSVSGTGQNVGAVVGTVNSGTVRYCANYAHVSSSYNGNARLGGIVGWLRSAGGTNNHLEYCINYGAVNGQSYVGGIVGSHGDGYVQYCQNYATITGTGTTAAGIMGWSTAAVNNYTHNHNGGNIVAGTGSTNATKRYFISNQSGSANLDSSNTFLNTLTVTLGGNVYTYTSPQISGYVKGATPVSSNPAGITIGGTTYGATTPAP